MLTINEQRTIREINDDPDVSLRDLVKKLDLGGVASATHIVNSLEKKGYVQKLGVATRKRYSLTPKALAFEEIINMKTKDFNLKNDAMYAKSKVVDLDKNGTDLGNENIPKISRFSTRRFPDSTGDDDSKNTLSSILSTSFLKVLDSPDGLQKYGEKIVLAVILTVLVLPLSVRFLKEDWLIGFVLITMALFVPLISNRK